MAKPRKRARASARQDRAPSASEPEVLLDVELVDGSLWLVLANASDHTAFDVSVAFDGPLMGVGGERDLSQMTIFRRLPILRPKRELRVFVDVARHLYARDQSTRLAARVAWHSRGGERFTRAFKHDLATWKDFGEIG